MITVFALVFFFPPSSSSSFLFFLMLFRIHARSPSFLLLPFNFPLLHLKITKFTFVLLHIAPCNIIKNHQFLQVTQAFIFFTAQPRLLSKVSTTMRFNLLWQNCSLPKRKGNEVSRVQERLVHVFLCCLTRFTPSKVFLIILIQLLQKLCRRFCFRQHFPFSVFAGLILSISPCKMDYMTAQTVALFHMLSILFSAPSF